MEELKKYLEYLHENLINQASIINMLKNSMILLCDTMQQSSNNNTEILDLLNEILNLIKEQKCI